MNHQHQPISLVVDEAGRLKQWMKDMPRVLANIVKSYLDYPNWVAHLFPPGDWEKLCPMLTLGHQHGFYGTDPTLTSERKLLWNVFKTSDMHTISTPLFAERTFRIPEDALSRVRHPCECLSPRRNIDFVSCGGHWGTFDGHMIVIMCDKGHFSFYHVTHGPTQRRSLSTSHYVALREIQHRISLLTEQTWEGIEQQRHLVEPLQKEMDHLLKSWYP